MARAANTGCLSERSAEKGRRAAAGALNDDSLGTTEQMERARRMKAIADRSGAIAAPPQWEKEA